MAFELELPQGTAVSHAQAAVLNALQQAPRTPQELERLSKQLGSSSIRTACGSGPRLEHALAASLGAADSS